MKFGTRSAAASIGAMLTATGLFVARDPDRLERIVTDAAGPEAAEALTAVDPSGPLSLSLAAFALLIGVLAAFTRSSKRTAAVPLARKDGEKSARLSGGSIDTEYEALATVSSMQGIDEERLDRHRDRLAAAVTHALIHHGHDREDAEQMVRDGSWTDDRLAAAFLGVDAQRVPLWYRLFEWFSAESAFHRRVRRTSTALSRLEER